MFNLHFFSVIGLSIIIGGIGALLVSKHAFRLGLLDMPNHRSSHTQVTAKGGGIGIVIALGLSSICNHISLFIWLPAIFLAILSLAGDRVDITPLYRLVAHFLAAIIVLIYIGRESPLILSFLNQSILHKFLVVLFTIPACIFIVGTLNFYNFMDGINGIAAITGAICFALLATYGYKIGLEKKYIILCISISASCIGFLPFNCPTAKVFMGDVGSILLGFMFAIMVLLIADSITSFLLLSGFLFPFYTDELITMTERIRDKKELFKPHRRHLYQVLANEAKIDHWKIALGYGLVQLVSALLFIKAKSISTTVLVSSMIVIGLIFFTVNKQVKEKYYPP